MTIAVLADEVLKQEWLLKPVAPAVEVVWVDAIRSLTMVEADAYFDLLFDNDPERIDALKPLTLQPVFINSVTHTLATLKRPFVRINAWPSLLQRSITEVALQNPLQQTMVKEVFDSLQWQYQIVPDTPGMLTARVLATIINEAYYTWNDGVSTKEEIDIAMKLGTNYPMGPFEWSRRIGLVRVYDLLRTLSITDSRYLPAPGITAEVRSAN